MSKPTFFLSTCLFLSLLYRHLSSLSPLSNCQNTASVFHSLGFHSSSQIQYFKNMTSKCPHDFQHLPGCRMSDYLLVTYPAQLLPYSWSWRIGVFCACSVIILDFNYLFWFLFSFCEISSFYLHPVRILYSRCVIVFICSTFAK